MSQKQVIGNWSTSHSDLKQRAIQNTSKFRCAPPRNDFPFALKRAKVYATRNFPPRGGDGVVASQVIENGTEGFPNPVTTKQLSAGNCVAYGPTKHGLKANEIANLRDVPPDVALSEKNKVKETLKLFWDLYKQLLDEYKTERKRGKVIGTRRFDMEAANLLKKKGKWIHLEKQFGQIPGVAIGDQFHFRAELAVVGLHCQYISGIDYVVLHGKKFAVSVVNSGRYENKAKTVDVLIYSGEGGHVGLSKKVDQKLQRGNLALVNSMKERYPVRVIRRSKNLKAYEEEGFGYTYDGLYIVERYWQERNDGKLVFKFELHRMSGQHKLGELKRITQKECCVVDDVSQGKENMPIRAMNGIDGEKPPSFAYITSMVYPEWCKQIQHSGCNCTNGCSNSGQCACILKNGGELSLGEKRSSLRQKAIVYECGPSCKCSVSCMNRVSQQGPRYKLELYKTESGGWGVRSRSFISSGSFVCEYVGKLQQTQNVDHERGRFGGIGFTIDASKMGNVGRFIRRSMSPNLFVQRVLYDHGDERMPHILFFAAKSIPPLQELTSDYNHQMDQNFQFQYRLQD